MQIKIDKGILEVNGENFQISFCGGPVQMWYSYDAYPKERQVKGLECMGRLTVRLKLGWEMPEWISQNQITWSGLSCSDGYGDVNFQNVVVELAAD